MASNIIFFDSSEWTDLLPLTFTRPVVKLRIGILTIEEKWKDLQTGECSFYTQKYLSEKYKIKLTNDNLFINGSVLPNETLIRKIENLDINSAIVFDNQLIAFRTSENDINFISSLIDNGINSNFKIINISNVNKIQNLWDIYQKTTSEIQNDFELLTIGKSSEILSLSNTIIGPKENIFIASGAKVEASFLNCSTGPIYIDEDAEIMEGSMIRGPFYIGKHSAIKMGSKIYGATSIGHNCKIGGEVNNSVFLDYSNKAHDGFIGNAVIGEWCNIGADTNNSNLKNNYAKVKLWSYRSHSFENTDQQFCGLFMGDHSKAGINTMFNTGTVVGVSANIFGPGFPRNFIPSFSWGGNHGFTTFNLNKAVETAEIMMARRGLKLDEIDKKIIETVFIDSKKMRSWEKPDS
jgi:UDP-N-acetylglucosamine diphosphorylase/glucosamine-1-phosphate N-acetyltransferase